MQSCQCSPSWGDPHSVAPSCSQDTAPNSELTRAAHHEPPSNTGDTPNNHTNPSQFITITLLTPMKITFSFVY